MRFEIHDEDGLLRRFHTKDEALRFLQEGWRLVIQPRPKKPSVYEYLATLEEAPF